MAFSVIFFLIIFLPRAIFPGIHGGQYVWPAAAFSFLLSIILGVLADIWRIRVSLKFVDGGKMEIKEIFSKVDLETFFNYLIAGALYGLIVFAGLILFIVPGIIWGLKYQLYRYFVVEKKLKPWEALKECGKATYGSKWNLFLFTILIGFISILGVITLGLGFAVIFPVIMLAEAFIYRKLA